MRPTRACIAGMHRSGTSMVAKVLRSAGLYLGEERDLMPARPDNQDGFWEHVGFVEVNDAVLEALGGWWDCPPARPPGWEAAPAGAMKPRVTRLLSGFSASARWGWKDPRNSLTLPFWLRFLPDLRVVVCLRNPLEVALSLRRRNTFSYALSLRLWHAYNHAVLAATRPEQRVVTHYDAHFRDPRGEARRLLDFLGMDATEDAVGAAASAPSPQLRHNRLTTQDLLDADVPREVFDLYVRMCAEAGWVAEDGASAAVPPAAPASPAPPAEPGPHESAADAAAVSLVGAAKLDRLGLLRREVESLGRKLAARDEEFRQLEAIVKAGQDGGYVALRELREQQAVVRRLRDTLAAREGAGAQDRELAAQCEALRATAREQEAGLREASVRLKLAESREQPLRAMLLEAQRRLVDREEELEAALAAEREQARQLRQQVEALRAEPGAPAAAEPAPVNGYQKMLGRIRDVAQVATPPGATVIVVSKGDEQLTALEGRRAWHFPRDANGQYAGHYPRDGADAVQRLESLREAAAAGGGAGGEVFLLLPATAYWWLDHYAGLKEHLARRYAMTWRDEACAIFSLNVAERVVPVPEVVTVPVPVPDVVTEVAPVVPEVVRETVPMEPEPVPQTISEVSSGVAQVLPEGPAGGNGQNGQNGQDGRNGRGGRPGWVRRLLGRHGGPPADREISPRGAKSRGVPPGPATAPGTDGSQGESQDDLDQKRVPNRPPPGG